MRIMEEPYFLNNEDWFFYDEEEGEYKLTEEGLKIEKVRKSYEDFYIDLKEGDNERDNN